MILQLFILFLARQDLDLSIIGEQSVHQEEEEISSQNDVQAQNDFDLDMSNRTEETESSELGNRSCDDSIVSQNSSVDEIQPAGEPEHPQRRRRSAVVCRHNCVSNASFRKYVQEMTRLHKLLV